MVDTKSKGLCCGAGGAQMFKEDEKGDRRINSARTDQVLDTNADWLQPTALFVLRCFRWYQRARTTR